VGKVYTGTVKRIMNFGAFCEIMPGKEGLLHVSEISDEFVESVEAVLKVGDEVPVKVIEIDKMGRVNLSKKQSTSDGPPIPLKRREDKGGPRGGDGGRRGENGKGSYKKKSWS
jgi:polyribonucleotide nucleotidyltransferase